MISDLLKTQKERLKIALKWEKEKGIPNPETSNIIDSIIKLELYDQNKEKKSRKAEDKTDGFKERLARSHN